jgi:hypothetical protein
MKREKLLEQAETYTQKKAELDVDMPKTLYIHINGKDSGSGVIVYDAFTDDLRIQRNNSACEVQFKGEQIEQLLSVLKGLIEK